MAGEGLNPSPEPQGFNGSMHHAPAGSLRLKVALAVTAIVAVIELAGGIFSHSLALLSDSAHVGMDVLALGIALAASIYQVRTSNPRQTFGLARLEILAALANGALLLAVTVLIAVAAGERFFHPVVPEAGLMSIVAGVGFVANAVMGASLARAAHADMNMRAAMLHVASDALGAFIVIAGGIAIGITHAGWIDPLLSLVVAAIIVAGVMQVIRDATHVLLESAPAHAQPPMVRDRLRELEGIVDVHDLHVWTLGSGSHAMAAHVLLADKRISEATAVLTAIDDAMRVEFAITHVTVQFECDSCTADERIVCTQELRAEALTGHAHAHGKPH